MRSSASGRSFSPPNWRAPGLVHQDTSSVHLFINPDLWVFLELEERTPSPYADRSRNPKRSQSVKSESRRLDDTPANLRFRIGIVEIKRSTDQPDQPARWRR